MMSLPILLVTQLAISAPAPPPARVGVGVGLDVYLFQPDALPAGTLSVVYGDRRGFDLDLKLSTIIIGSIVEGGARYYLGDDRFQVFGAARGGALLAYVFPIAASLTAGGGVAIPAWGSTVFEIEGAYYTTFGDTRDTNLGHGARITALLRF